MLLTKIRTAATHWTDSGLTLLGVGGGQRTDPLFKSLKAILPDEDDARHVFQAAKNGVQYFLTVDERTILRHRQAVEQCCELKAVDPEQMLQVINSLPRNGT